jgi:N,N'-diacetyllegionaminate synthase
MKTFVIAEIGPNHNGSLETAMNMVEELKGSGANAIKFQLAQPEAVYSADAFKADYQKKNDGFGSVIEMSRRLQLSRESHSRIQKACASIGMLYMCTAFDLDSLEFLDQVLDIPLFKIASGELLSIDMLEYISERKKPVFLSTGMANFDEISAALGILRSKGLEDITLLHCVSNYPAPHVDMNLLVMPELAKKFGCKTGFSDHSIGAESCLAAVALGAEVIEKHVTLDKEMPGPDHKASATIKEFAAMVSAIRCVELALGQNKKKFSSAEENIRRMARKSIVAARNLPAGTIICGGDITFKRPGTGLSPFYRDQLIGKKVVRDVQYNHVIYLEDIQGDLL